MDSFSYVNGRPTLRATLKRDFEDFKVNENLGFELTGAGDHQWLQLHKTDISTIDVARSLAELLNLDLKSIGYSGMKDRRAECSQWFSVPASSCENDELARITGVPFTLLQSTRNSKKLKIGTHRSNLFSIRLRDCQGETEDFDSRLNSIAQNGVANYFGPQRFGRELSNIDQVKEMMARVLSAQDTNPRKAANVGRFKRGILLSAARGYLFNHLLSYRIQQRNWDQYLPGDVLSLNNTSRFFGLKPGEEWDETLQKRLANFDIHISGALAGKKDSKDRYASWGEAADIEEVVFSEFSELIKGLEHFELLASQRSLRFIPDELSWDWNEGESGVMDLLLKFELPKGAYATSLLRELCLTD